MRRRILWLAVPTAVGGLLGLLIALVWPAEYRAASTVVIQPQGVPEQLVQTTVSSDTEARYGQIKLQILARNNLSEIIEEFSLYADEVASMPREELIERMRGKIGIEPLPPAIIDPRKPVQIESFEIAFRGKQPKVVAEVVNRLTRDFLSENLRERRGQASGTSEFIDEELARAEADRARLLQDMMTFSEDHQGEMPVDRLDNQRRLDRLEVSRRRVQSELELAEQNASRIGQQIREVRLHGADETADPVSRRRMLEMEVSSHLARGKTERHPDVLIARAELAQLSEMIEAEFETDAPLSPLEATLRNEERMHLVRSTVLRKELDRIDDQVDETEKRLAATPQRAAFASQLQANIEGLNQQIMQLQAKKISADLGQQVELVEKGEKFRIIDTAEIPTAPVSPNRPLVFLVSLVIGGAIGVLLLLVREMSDDSFHHPSDLQSTLELPVLASISVIELAQDRAQSRGRLRRFAITGGVLLAVVAGGSLVTYLVESGVVGTLGEHLSSILDGVKDV